jgi:V-type H+-transporting ATPase subunit H
VDEFAASEKPFENLTKHIDEDDYGLLSHLFLSFGVLSRKVREETDKTVLTLVMTKLMKKFSTAIDLNGDGVQQVLGCTSGLMYLLQRENAVCRTNFLSKGGLKKLLEVLRIHTNSIQVCYESVFCLWILSFTKDMETYFSEVNISATLHLVLKKHQKEKVVRIVLYTLKNLMTKQSFINSIIAIGLPKTLFSLSKREYSDSDILELVKELHMKTESWIDELSSFAEYRQEVLSGQLEWSPVHKSTKFWQQNLDNFEDSGYSIIRELIKLLRESRNTKTLEVAIHDIGQFIEYCQEGKR